jgi:hypothetical protein
MTQTASDYRRRPGSTPMPVRRSTPMFGSASARITPVAQTMQTQPAAVPMFGGPVVLPAGTHPQVVASVMHSMRAPQVVSQPTVSMQPMRRRSRLDCPT